MNTPIDTNRMIAAHETAQRNPMRPPDTSPRDARTALTRFWTHISTLLIASFILALGSWRLTLGDFTWVDAAIAVTILAYFPINEWLIHVFMLHFKPRRLFGRMIDLPLPRSHRRHHADPWNLSLVFIPRHVHLLVAPTIVLLLWALWPWKAWVLTAITTYLLLGLHYEWVHFLAHIPWCPQRGLLGRYYQRRVREHRYHHFRNENYWWGVSMGLGDRLFGTAPPVDATERSGTTHTAGT